MAATLSEDLVSFCESRTNFELIFKLVGYAIQLTARCLPERSPLAADLLELADRSGEARALVRSPLGFVEGLLGFGAPRTTTSLLGALAYTAYLSLDQWLWLEPVLKRRLRTGARSLNAAVRAIYAAWLALTLLMLWKSRQRLRQLQRQIAQQQSGGQSPTEGGQGRAQIEGLRSLAVAHSSLLRRAIVRYLLDVPLALLPALDSSHLQLSERSTAALGVASGLLGVEVAWTTHRLDRSSGREEGALLGNQRAYAKVD